MQAALLASYYWDEPDRHKKGTIEATGGRGYLFFGSGGVYFSNPLSITSDLSDGCRWEGR